MVFAFRPHPASSSWSPQNCETFEPGTVMWFTVSSHSMLFKHQNHWAIYCNKNVGQKKFNPLTFLLSLLQCWGVLPDLGVSSVGVSSLSLPHACLCRSVSRLPALNGGPGREPSCFPCVGFLCWANSGICPGRFTRVVQTQSGVFFFFFWVIIKNFCQVLSVGGRGFGSTWSLKCRWTCL